MTDEAEAWVLDHKIPNKITRSNIAAAIQNLSISASYEIRGNTAIIRTQHDTGTYQYFAKASEEIFLLKHQSYKSEIKGNFTIFHIKLEG